MSFAFSLFFVGQKINETVLIQNIIKDDKWDFCVINKKAVTHWVISDTRQNKCVCIDNDTKQFLSIKNIYNS